MGEGGGSGGGRGGAAAVAVTVMVVVEAEGASGSDVDGRLSLSSANNIQHSPLYSPHHLRKPSSGREAHSGSRVRVIRACRCAGVCTGFVLCISIDTYSPHTTVM